MQLAGFGGDFADLGIGVTAMTYDERGVLAGFHAEHELGYPLLQDLEAAHVNAFGVRNEAYGPGDDNYGLALPGILWIDADGTVRGKWAVPDYRERPPFADVLEEIRVTLAD